MGLRTANICTGNISFSCQVEFGKETTHPDSPLKEEGQILDENVPKDLIVFFTVDGRVRVTGERPKTRFLLPEDVVLEDRVIGWEENEEDQFIVGPGMGEVDTIIRWPNHWIHVLCHTEGEVDYTVELLQQGDWKYIPSNTVVLL